eukprot:6751041-Prymnesium_polylepis.1
MQEAAEGVALGGDVRSSCGMSPWLRNERGLDPAHLHHLQCCPALWGGRDITTRPMTRGRGLQA